MSKNFARMMQVIEDTFAMRDDPGQIEVNAQQRRKLEALHASTLSELANEDGPLIWVLLVPTTRALMYAFLDGSISEKELLEQTPVGVAYDCLYLCSVSALPEVRGKGKSKDLCLQAIRAIAANHPIQCLFVWPFSKEGLLLAQGIGKELGMEVLVKA